MVGRVRSRWCSFLLAAAVLLAPALLSGGCDTRRKDVEESIRQLSHAMAGGDGETAASLYARPTLGYYDRLVKLAREAKRDEIARMTPLERFEIIRLRHRSTLAEMKPLDGRGYIIATAKNPIEDVGELGRVVFVTRGGVVYVGK